MRYFSYQHPFVHIFNIRFCAYCVFKRSRICFFRKHGRACRQFCHVQKHAADPHHFERRSGRVYAELLHHKMRLIDVIDGKSYVDIEKYLYPKDAFIKIKKLLYDEYFALFSYDPFFKNTKSYKAVTDFNSLHQDLLNYLRSQHIDNIEYNNLKILYQKVYRQPIVADTPAENFNHPDIIEAMENFRSGLDYALFNADTIMTFIDKHLEALDEYFHTGEPWTNIKERFNQEFQHWVQNPEEN